MVTNQVLQETKNSYHMTTFQNETIDTTDQFPSSASEYLSKFKEVHKDPKSSRVYISYKIDRSFHFVTSNTEINNNPQASSILW